MVYYTIPNTAENDFGEYYNKFMYMLPNTTDFACFIPPGTSILSPDFLKTIERVIEENPDVGCFTSVTNKTEFSPQISPGIRKDDLLFDHKKHGSNIEKIYGSYCDDITNHANLQNLTSGILLLRKSTWRQLKGFVREDKTPIPQTLHKRILLKNEKLFLMKGVYHHSWEDTTEKQHQPIDLSKKKLVFGITTYNRLEFLKTTISTWYQTINKNHNWTLIISDDNSTDGTWEYVNSLKLDGVYIIKIKNDHRGVHHQTNQILKLSSLFDFDIGFKADDDLIFLKPGWDDLYIKSIELSGYEHLIFYEKNWGGRRNEIRDVISRRGVENCVETKKVQGALWTYTHRVIKNVGYFDTNQFGLCGIGHVDYSIRCCRMGFNEFNNPFDAANSNDYIKLNQKNYFTSNENRKLWNTPELIKEKHLSLDKQNRGWVEYNEIPVRMDFTKLETTKPLFLSNFANRYFDEIYCVNLDRRTDKWVVVNNRFKKLGLTVSRFSAVDGNTIDDNILQTYEKINRYEVGCILSHYQIITEAKNRGLKKILILEDDVIFALDFFIRLFDLLKTIDNWDLLYLGGSQHHWGGITFHDGYYMAHKVDGTFAYAINHTIYDDILNTKEINNKPIDTKLWSVQEKHKNSSYCAHPNLIISDVSDSNIRGSRNNYTHRKSRKWDLIEYDETKNISIIIPAYKSENFIEECLDSINSQLIGPLNNVRFEILVGVDACKSTEQKLREIKHKYNNLRLFQMKHNMGPYVIKNTLINECKYERILFFDADDVMEKNMIDTISQTVGDIIRFSFFDFIDGDHITQNTPSKTHAHGVFLCDRKVIDYLGGFESWRCGADTEFDIRSAKHFNVVTLNNSLFYRRIHKDSLTQHEQTGIKSELREHYRNLIKNKFENNDYVPHVEVVYNEYSLI